ncbi:23S rRNA (guanosine(2251)-2'-O)-methyltransferase RlmB [bacterium]|nr:23S rRNA (guanosine(2251)-2'-O)-methyltransferase RlmB [bacterium]
MGHRHTLAKPKQEIVCGANPVLELIKSRPQSIDCVFIAAGSKREREAERLGKIVRVRIVERRELDGMVHEVPHQGILAVLRQAKRGHGPNEERSAKPQTSEQIDAGPDFGIATAPTFADFCKQLERAADQTENLLVVALDEVQDPHNFGAILRASACAGARAVLIAERRSAPLSIVARKASAGASERIPVIVVANLRDALQKLKKYNLWIVGTELGAKSQSLYQTELPQRAVVVVGSEGAGIRPIISQECDFHLEIPMPGKFDSLNVSQATSIVLFEFVRQGILKV